MNYLRQKSGYTLIEVIAATAIFLIAAMVFSALLMQGYRNLGIAGSRSIAVHSAETEIEGAIKNPALSSEEISSEPYTLEVFGQQISGRLITVTKSFPGHPEKVVTYTTFVPDGKGD